MLQFIKSWFSREVRELLFSVAKHEFNSCYYNILDFFGLEAAAQRTSRRFKQ